MLTDGQILAGRLSDEPIQLELEGGEQMAVQADMFQAATYALSEARPPEIALDQPVLALRGGQRLVHTPPAETLEFQTEYGTLALPLPLITTVELAATEGGLHVAKMVNGTVLSGILTADALAARITPELPITVPPALLERIIFPARSVTSGQSAKITLRNDNILIGEIHPQSLTVETEQGVMTIPCHNIAEFNAVQGGAPGSVELTLHSGREVSGQLTPTNLSIDLADGLTVSIYTGHVVTLTTPKPPEPEPTTQPTTQPVDEPTTQPTDEPTTQPSGVAELEEQLAAATERTQSLRRDLQDATKGNEVDMVVVRALERKFRQSIVEYDRLRAELKQARLEAGRVHEAAAATLVEAVEDAE